MTQYQTQLKEQFMRIAVASGKGGTGKTFLSVNLAKYLSQFRPIVLADLDVEEPNSGLFLKGELIAQEDRARMIPQWIPEPCTLCRECQYNCNFNAIIQAKNQIMIFPQLCHSCYACADLCPENALRMVPQKMGVLSRYRIDNLCFIEARLNIGEEMATPMIAQAIDYLDKNFSPDILQILDSPPGTSCPVIEAVKKADFVILITEPTPFGLHDLTLAVDTMKKLHKDFAVVINRYNLGNKDVEDYCAEDNIPIITRIANDRRIAELYSAGQLVYDKVDHFSKALGDIIDFLSLKTTVK